MNRSKESKTTPYFDKIEEGYYQNVCDVWDELTAREVIDKSDDL